jgi:hypothetical protein
MPVQIHDMIIVINMRDLHGIDGVVAMDPDDE